MRHLIRFANFVVVALLVSGGACQGDQTMNTYSEDQIERIEIVDTSNGEVAIDIQPMLESAHFLAGARIEQAEGRRRLTLVRCAIGSDCDVDAPAIIEAGTPDPYRVTLEGTEMPIDIVFADGTSRNVYEPGT